MKNIESNKRIDVIKTNITPLATFKQGDKGVLILELFRNGTPFDIGGQTIILGAYRPNQTVVEQIDGFNINNNILTINFKNSIFALPGLVELDLELTDTEGEMTTSSFYIKVNKKVLGDDNLNASDEFNSLKQLKIDLTALNEKASRDENTRITNEMLRASAEIERQDFYENTAKPTLESLKDFDSQITENTNQIDNAKIGFDGKEHSSLKHRLDADYSEVKEQFNSNSYLPFEGENVTVEHSLNGVTKDMELRGRTLQNLFSIKDVIPESSFTIEGSYINIPSVPNYPTAICQYKKPLVKDNTNYILIANIVSNTLNDVTSFRLLRPESYDGKGFTLPSGFTTGIITHKFTTNKANATGWDQNYANIFIQKPNITGSIKFSMMILEDTGVEVPVYFEGIKSVGDKSKNLFNKNNVTLGYINDTNGIFQEIGTDKYASDYICIKGMSNLYLNTIVARWIAFYTKDKVYISGSSGVSNLAVPSDAYYIRITVQVADVDWVQLEEGTKFTGYEPYYEGHRISNLSTGKNMVSYKDFNLKLLPAMPPQNRLNVAKNGYVEVRSNSGSYNCEMARIYVKKNTAYYFCVKNDNSNAPSLGETKPMLDVHNSDLTRMKQIHGGNIISFNSGNNDFVYIGFNISSMTQIPVNEYMKIYDIILSESITIPEYEPYQSDKKEILLNQPLRGLSQTFDKIYEKDGKVFLEQNIGRIIIDGRVTPSILNQFSNESTICFYINVQTTLYGLPKYPDKAWGEGDTPISDKFIYNINILSPESIQKSFGLINASPNYACFRVPKTEIGNDLSAESIKSYMQNNPVTIYYKMPIPIITELDISSIEFRTYLERTHFISLNKIPATASFKAPVDVPATISTLRSKSEGLEQENKKLKEEVNTKTLKLHGQDVELTNSDLDLDFRIFELEMNIGAPINLNMKGMRSMARSPFEMMKILILNNNYDREDIEYKASRYLQGKRMTQAEYDEIISLMDATEIVK